MGIVRLGHIELRENVVKKAHSSPNSIEGADFRDDVGQEKVACALICAERLDYGLQSVEFCLLIISFGLFGFDFGLVS